MQQGELAAGALRPLLQHQREMLRALNGQLLLQGQDDVLPHTHTHTYALLKGAQRENKQDKKRENSMELSDGVY